MTYYSIVQHTGCSKYDNCCIDALGILHKKVIDLAVNFHP